VVVESIDKDMAGSPELATRIRDGLAQLSKAAGGDFTAVNAEKQVEAMQILEGTPFFSDMLNDAVLFLQQQDRLAKVGPHFGRPLSQGSGTQPWHTVFLGLPMLARGLALWYTHTGWGAQAGLVALMPRANIVA
jgi:hypothetical protein